jgi:CubicO group peptidase (beta-lactamase class C family)
MKIYIAVIFVLSLTSCLKDGSLKLPYKGFVPQANVNDWELSTPQKENIDVSLLDQAYQLIYRDDRYLMARSLLVFRNGKLIAEAYPHDINDINAINNIQSCTKSVTSILTGIAVKNKIVASIDEKLYSIYPELFDDDILKRDISLKDALTMRTGLYFDNSEHTLELYRTKKNSATYVLSLEKLYKAGLVMNYNDGSPQLISKALEKKCGKTLSQYAKEELFQKLNINNWKWEEVKDGTTFGAFSLYIRARDFGKIGQLLLQKGSWNGEQIIDSTYLKEATSTQTSANFNNEPYGYYFWILPAWNAYAALGHGGQFLLIVPDKDLVVVYTAWPYTSSDLFDSSNLLMSLIIQSCL